MVINRFGGIKTLTVQVLPVPQVGPGEVLIQVAAAGVSVWDFDECEGRFAGMFGASAFPYVLGWDGAGMSGSSVPTLLSMAVRLMWWPLLVSLRPTA